MPKARLFFVIVVVVLPTSIYMPFHSKSTVTKILDNLDHVLRRFQCDDPVNGKMGRPPTCPSITMPNNISPSVGV